jgi:hypothetical protein
LADFAAFCLKALAAKRGRSWPLMTFRIVKDSCRQGGKDMTAFIFSTSLHRYLLVLPVLFALTAESVEATVFTVGRTGGIGAACTLADAIIAADNNIPTGGCPAGSEDDTASSNSPATLF